jgi:uncharacterized protein YjbI with pentapeptide repeats
MKGKKLLSLIILLISVSLMIYSCGSSDSIGIKTSEVALSEYAFKDDANLYAQFSHVTVLDFEHAQETNINEKDSGSPGVDIIPFMVIFGQNLTFEFEDMGNGNHYAILRNENEKEVARMDPDENFVTVYLLAGKYKLYLYNMGTETFPLFLQPLTVDVGSNRQASFNPFQYLYFLIGHTCSKCDLSHSTLAHLNLTYARLDYANLNHTNLSYTNLSYAILEEASLAYANLSHANLTDTTLRYANMAFWNLTGANVCSHCIDSNLEGANLTGATYVDGVSICQAGSVGQCIY